MTVTGFAGGTAVASGETSSGWGGATRSVSAVACLGVSVIADQVGPLFPSWHFMEAAAQLLGTFLWFAFAFCASRGLLRAQAHMDGDVRASSLASPESLRRTERQLVS